VWITAIPYYCRTLFPVDKEHLVDELLARAEVDPTTRPQQLSMEDFSRLCNIYRGYCDQYPDLLEYYYRDPDNLAAKRQMRLERRESLLS